MDAQQRDPHQYGRWGSSSSCARKPYRDDVGHCGYMVLEPQYVSVLRLVHDYHGVCQYRKLDSDGNREISTSGMPDKGCIVKVRHSYVLALLVWMYALSLSLPPLFSWGKYGLEAGNISCSVSWELHDPETHSGTYIAFIFVLGFFLPVILISSSYCGIVRILRNMNKRISLSNRRETKVIRMVYLMILAFLIAWSPYAVLALATQYFYARTSYIVAVLPCLLAKSSICYNPIIYACLNVQFSRAWKKMFFINKSTTRNSQHTGMTTLNKKKMRNLNRRQQQQACQAKI
ncbi:green-sensitive opsin isoform X3 [Ooceraea biroi]|uniref:green-sensitive opsin isoform X3 n=1 Tax=Ooceraea biroi TaxID=2015173 RepID=UPI000F094280|nr:green-sensitive opsin isoform X3 [Ooceraea biroi]